jgi:hypothetical protein
MPVGAICLRLRGERHCWENIMNANEQMIREQAYELWDHAGRPDGRSKRRILVRCESRIRTRGGDRRGKPQRACSPACGGRLVMNRALIKGNGDLTQLGGPDEPACDFERRSLRRDAGAGI